jgi:hypothetical protein
VPTGSFVTSREPACPRAALSSLHSGRQQLSAAIAPLPRVRALTVSADRIQPLLALFAKTNLWSGDEFAHQMAFKI